MKEVRHLLQRGVFGVGVLAGLAAVCLIANAEQLEGVQVKPVGNSVQVILDTPNDQPYRIERHGENNVTIIMPKTKLPTAFQATGLPPVKDKETGVTAQVSPSGEGVAIQLTAPKGVNLPYEVRLNTRHAKNKAPQPKSPLALFDSTPASSVVFSIPKQQKEIVVPNADRPKAALKKSKTPLFTATSANSTNAQAIDAAPILNPPLKKSSRPVSIAPRQRRVYKAPPQVVGFENEPAPASQAPVAPVASPAPTQVATEAVQTPDIADSKTAIANEPATNGVNFLNQVQRQTPHHAPVFKKPSQSPTVYHLPFTKMSVTRSLIRWFAVSLVLFGSLLVCAVLIGLWLKKRMIRQQKPLLEPVGEQEFFEPPPVKHAPAPETYDAYLKQEEADEKRKTVSRPDNVSSFKKVLSHPAVSTQDVLNTPIRSVSDAVRIGLVRKKSNPYLVTPFEIARHSSVKRETAPAPAAVSPQNDPRKRSFQRIATYR